MDDIVADPDLDARWDKLLQVRGEITRVLEAARRDKIIGLSLDAEVLLASDDSELTAFLKDNQELLGELCIVSALSLTDNLPEGEEENVESGQGEALTSLRIAVRPAKGEKCERCWVIDPSVGQDSDHPTLCARCSEVVRKLTN